MYFFLLFFHSIIAEEVKGEYQNFGGNQDDEEQDQ